MAAGDGRLSAEGEGRVVVDDGVLVVERIEVRYRLRLSEDQVEAAERAHEGHAERCPVARTLRGCVQIETALDLEIV